MKYALFSVPVGTIYDLPQTIKEGEAGLVSTIGDEGLYGQACQVRTAPGSVTAAGVQLPPDVAEVVSFYGYHGYVNQRELQFVREEELWEYLGGRPRSRGPRYGCPQPAQGAGRPDDGIGAGRCSPSPA